MNGPGYPKNIWTLSKSPTNERPRCKWTGWGASDKDFYLKVVASVTLDPNGNNFSSPRCGAHWWELIMVENFGLYLKQERELRGVALGEIAETTKIHIRYLEALENNDFDNMPGEVFVKGFIRSYARAIGIDSEEIVNAYDESIGCDRKEKLEKVQVTNNKIRSRKKTAAGFVLGGIALIVISFLGYLVVGNIIDENEKQGVDRIPVEESSPETENPPTSSETIPLDKIESDDTESSDNAGNLNEEPQKESLQNEPPSSNVENLSKTRSKVTLEKPSSSATADSIPAISTAKVNKPAAARSEPRATEIKTEPSEKPSEPQDDNKVALETPIEPAVTQKDSDLSEKPVIIQQVIEKLELSEATGPSLPKPSAKPLHLKIEVQGNSWFNITVDGSKEEDFILPGGSSKNIYGKEKIRLTIGNRSGTSLFLNGKAIELPSGTNDVIRNFDVTANLLE